AAAEEPASAPTPEPSEAPKETPAEPVASTPEPAAPVEDKKTATEKKAEDAMLFEAALASLGSEEPSSSREVGGVGSLTKGERITAKVILVENDKVFVDLGTKAEGVVPLSELANENLETAIGHV